MNQNDNDKFILDHIKQSGIDVAYILNPPPEPSIASPGFLDHLEQYALRIQIRPSNTPAILRQEIDGKSKFILDRDEKKRAYYKDIRSALSKLIFELKQKEAGKKDS